MKKNVNTQFNNINAKFRGIGNVPIAEDLLQRRELYVYYAKQTLQNMLACYTSGDMEGMFAHTSFASGLAFALMQMSGSSPTFKMYIEELYNMLKALTNELRKLVDNSIGKAHIQPYSIMTQHSVVAQPNVVTQLNMLSNVPYRQATYQPATSTMSNYVPPVQSIRTVTQPAVQNTQTMLDVPFVSTLPSVQPATQTVVTQTPRVAQMAAVETDDVPYIVENIDTSNKKVETVHKFEF